MPVDKEIFCSIECDCVDRDAWDDYVTVHPSASNYHRYGWRDVIENSFGHPCHYLAARDESKRICGVLPLVFMESILFGRFLVSQPFLNYGGLLCDNREVGNALLIEAAKLREKLGAEHVEIRHKDPWQGNVPTKQHKVSMVLDLAGTPEEQWKAFNAKLRNQIRKADKSELVASVGGIEHLTDFYAVFVRNMRDLGTPVYSQKLFSEVIKSFPDCTRIVVVHLGDKPVAGGLLTWFHDTIEIPWASSNRDFNYLCPNNLLYWTSLKFAMEHGLRRFDFGRSTPGEGTYRFKEQWGAKPIQLNWQYLLPEGSALPELNTKNPKFELLIKIWQKLPLSVTKILGPGIVKNIP